MPFLLEANTNVTGRRYRLQKEGDWRYLDRSMDNKLAKLSSGDKAFDSLDQLRPYFDKNYKNVELEGRVYSLPKEIFTLSSSYLEVKVLRASVPRLFSEKEMKRVISEGDDSRHNSLVIDLEGYPQLWRLEEARQILAPLYVRCETFAAGNGYVG